MGAPDLITILAAAAAPAASQAPTTPLAAADQVGAIVVEGRVPVVGDLQKGVMAFQPSFFAKVAPTTAMDMVQWLPGFTFTDTRDMRGLENAGGNVLIDGKPPTSKTDTLESVLKRIPSEQVERIDIIVGGAPGIDMHGWPVIANVVLKTSATRRKTVTVADTTDRWGRTAPTVTLNSSRKDDSRTVEASLEAGSHYWSEPPVGDGTWRRTDGAGLPVITADARTHNGGPYAIGSGAYEQGLGGGRLRLNASGRYYGSFFDETDLLASGAGQYGYVHSQTYLQGELGVGYEHPLGAKTTLDTQVLERPTRYHSINDLDRPPEPSSLHKFNNEDESVLRATVRYKPSDKLTFETAAEGDLNTVATHSAETLNGAPFPLPDADVSIREHRAEVGETVSWKPSPKTSLDGFLKVEESSLVGEADGRVERDFGYAKPRLVFTWSPDKDTQLRLRGEHEVGQIAFDVFAANTNFATGTVYAGNTQIRPQRDWVGEMVLERRFWTGGDITVTLRQGAYSDVIDAIPIVVNGVADAAIGNIGGGTKTDVIVNLTLPLKRLGLEGGTLKAVVNWDRSRVTDPVTGLRRPFSYQEDVSGELHFAEDLPAQKLNVGFDAFYEGPDIGYLPLGDLHTGVYVHANLFVEYRPSTAWNLRGEVDNLFEGRPRSLAYGYQGLKGLSPLLYVDDRRQGSGPLLMVRVRRTFL